MAEATPVGRFHWITRHVPTRETVHEYRLLRPFASRLTDTEMKAVADYMAGLH